MDSPRDRRIVLFGVGSPFAIDVEESCARLGIEIVAAVHNVPGPHYISGPVVTRSIGPCSMAVGNPARVVKTGLPALDLTVPA